MLGIDGGGKEGETGTEADGYQTPEHSWDLYYERDGNDRLLALEKMG